MLNQSAQVYSFAIARCAIGAYRCHMQSSSPFPFVPVMQRRETLSRQEVAQVLGVSVQGLYQWEKHGAFPKAVRLAPKLVRYLRRDLSAWLRERMPDAPAEFPERDLWAHVFGG